MIQEVQNSKGLAAITSDLWHVVLAHLTHPGAKRPFVRGVASEHADRASCWRSANALRRSIAANSDGVPKDERDEVFVRRPNFKSLKRAKARRRRPAGPKRETGRDGKTAKPE